MIKLFMVAHMSFDYLEYRLIIDEEDEFDPRIEFRFWFLDEDTDTYSKEVIVSLDHAVLFDLNNMPIIGDSTAPQYSESMCDMFGLKADTDTGDVRELDLITKNNKVTKTHLFHLLIKALILISNMLDIDLQKANINSYIGAIRGGKIYRLEPRENFDPKYLELNLHDVMLEHKKGYTNRKDPELAHSMWVADNLLEVLTSIKNSTDTNLAKKLLKRKPTIAGLAEQNRLACLEQMCQKRIPIPYSPYAIMVKNLFESDVLLGITAGNTFLYILDSLEVDDTGDLRIHFLNPIRGNNISVDLYTILSGLKRMGLILDRSTLHQLSTMEFD